MAETIDEITEDEQVFGAGDCADTGAERSLSSAQRARSERNRLRARALREARLAPRGGFLPEAGASEAPRARAPPAPIADPAARPACLECGRAFAASYLFDSFSYRVCDACRDDEDAHALLTRTQAKSLYLLQDCDLDAREPPLRCVRRRNPHGARRADMRLYLRAQLHERALQAWGSQEALERERARREEARARSAARQSARRLRALRMDVRSSLFDRTRAPHVHVLGAETHDAAADVYSRVCAECGYVESYEKM